LGISTAVLGSQADEKNSKVEPSINKGEKNEKDASGRVDDVDRGNGFCGGAFQESGMQCQRGQENGQDR